MAAHVFTWLLGQSLPSNLSKWLPIHIYLATKLQSLLDSIQTWPAAQNGCQSVITWPVEQSLPSCYSKWLPLETSQGSSLSNPDFICHSKWLPINIHLATYLKSLLDSIQTWQSVQNGCHYWSCMHSEAVVVAINLLPCLQFEFPAMLMHLACKKGELWFSSNKQPFPKYPASFT